MMPTSADPILSDEPVDPPCSPRPRALSPATWRLVFLLAIPVLAQQALIFSVGLSDRFLTGRLQTIAPTERTEVIAHHLLALGSISGQGPVAALANVGMHHEPYLARQASFQAAQTTAHYLAWFITCYNVLVSVGSTALVARFTGAGDHASAVAVTHQSLLLAIFLGLAASLWGLTGGVERMVSVLQLRGEAAQNASAFLQPLFALIVFQVIQSAGIACLVGAGDTRSGLYVTLGVALANLPLAWAFCLGWGPFPRLNFVGIAVGTALSHTLGGLAVLAILIRGRFGLKLAWRLFRPRWDLLRRLLRISIPAGFDSLSVVAGQFWFLTIVNRLGNVQAAAHGLALQWEALGYLSGAAFGTAAMTLVGQNLGARRPDQAQRAGWLAFYLGTGVMCLMGLIFFVLAEPMFLLFCPQPDQQPIVAAGVPLLRMIAFAMPALSCTIIFTNALRGAGDTRVPVLFTWIGFFVVRIPLAYFLTQDQIGPLPGMGWGLMGAWLAMLADLVVRGVFFFGRFARGKWRLQKV